MAITHSLRCNDFTEKLTKWLVGNLKFLNKKTAVMATQVCARGKGRQRSKKLFPLKFMFLQKNRNNLCGIKKTAIFAPKICAVTCEVTAFFYLINAPFHAT